MQVAEFDGETGDVRGMLVFLGEIAWRVGGGRVGSMALAQGVTN